MEATTTSKIAIAALAAAAIIVGPISATEASAKNGHRTNAAIGIAAGIGGVLLGAAIANAKPQAYSETRYQAEPRHLAYGFRPVGAYAVDEKDCFKELIRRFDHYSRLVVTIGTKVVCR